MIEDWLANFEDLALIFKEIEDSFMCREPNRDDVHDKKVIKKVMKNCHCNDYESFFNNSESKVIRDLETMQ